MNDQRRLAKKALNSSKMAVWKWDLKANKEQYKLSFTLIPGVNLQWLLNMQLCIAEPNTFRFVIKYRHYDGKLMTKYVWNWQDRTSEGYQETTEIEQCINDRGMQSPNNSTNSASYIISATIMEPRMFYWEWWRKSSQGKSDQWKRWKEKQCILVANDIIHHQL